MKRLILSGLLLAALALHSTRLHSQVTIGSGIEPMKGALLDLKEKADGTSVRGLGLPRVRLTSNNDITNGDITGVTAANKDEHIGLIVYNTGSVTGSAATLLCPGLHVWDGDKWSSIVPYPTIDPTKTIIGKNITAENSRSIILDPIKYPIGPLNQFTDTRGPGNIETNQYHHARFYTHRVNATGDVTYSGIKQPYVCDASLAVVEDWTETGIAFEYVDDGVWMTENLNTKYQTADATATIAAHVLGGGAASNSVPNPQYATPSNTGASPAQIKQNGLLYNWAAATNKKGPEGMYDPFKEHQGICPAGWHLPSDKEWSVLEATYAPTSSQFTNSPTTDFPWLANYNTDVGWRPNGANVFGHGKSMKSTTNLTATATDGDSKTAADGGFNILLTGVALSGTVILYGESNYLWSASSAGLAAHYRRVYYSLAGMYRHGEDRYFLSSVRCKKNS